jgi:nicotinamidase-related amidase
MLDVRLNDIDLAQTVNAGANFLHFLETEGAQLGGKPVLTIDGQASTLLLIDFQAKLMPAIDEAGAVIANARRLIEAASMVGAPMLFTEQYAKGLGPTVAELAPPADLIAHKVTFDACRAPDFLPRLPEGRALVVGGCEAHICVLQTALGLIEAGRRVFVVRDAIGSRRAESKETAIRRMERHGVEIVTTEMVVFEWLQTAAHPRFREAAALIR